MAEEKQHKKRKFLFNPLKRPLPYLGLILAILLLVFQGTIRIYVSDSLGEIMVDAIKESTGGEYKIKYDVVRFDIISKELRISNLSIELDTNVISREDYLNKKPNLIDIKAPIIIVKLRSILPLIFQDQLFISYVGARDPDFSLVKSPLSSAMDDVAEESREDVMEVVKNYFAALEIDSFRIISGSLDIKSQDGTNSNLHNIRVGEFSTTLKNFRIDSLSPSILLRGISATTLELEIRDQEIVLPSDNKRINFERLWMSSPDSTISIDSLVVQNLKHGVSHNQVYFDVDQLKILGLNFERAFNQNELGINELQIASPKIILKMAKSKTKVESYSMDFPIIYEYFKQLNINKINFQHGSLLLEESRKSEVKDLSFRITNYNISEEDWALRKPISNIHIAMIKAIGIEQELPDSIHQIKVEEINFTDSNNLLIADNTSVKPIAGRNYYKTLRSRNSNISTTLNVKTIKAINIKPEQLLLKEPLEIDSVILERPSGSLLHYPNMGFSTLDDDSDLPDFSIKHLFANYGSLRYMSIKNGVRQQTRLNGIYFSLTEVSPYSFDDGFPANGKLRIASGEIALKKIGHTATFANLSTSGLKHSFVENLTIRPDSATLPYHQITGQLNNIKIGGLDKESLSNKSISIDSVTVGSINLTGDFNKLPFETGGSDPSNLPDKFSIRKLSLNNSSIEIASENNEFKMLNAALSARNVLIDSLGQVSTKDNIHFSQLLLNFGKFRITNKIDSTTTNGLSGYYSALDSTLILKDIRYQSPGKALDIRLKELDLIAINKSQLLKHSQLRFRRATIQKPTLNIDFSLQSHRSNPFDLSKLVLKNGLKGIDFDTLSLVDASSKLTFEDGRLVTIGRINGLVKNYSIDTLSTFKEAIERFDGMFELQETNMVGTNDTLEIHKLFVDSKTNNIWTDSIYYHASLEKQTLRLKSPGIAIHKIDIPLMFKNQLSFNRITSRNNQLNIIQLDTTGNQNTKKIPVFKLPFNAYIASINFKNTKLTYHHPVITNHPLSNLQFDFEVDSMLVAKNAYFDVTKNTSDVRLRSYNFEYKLPDSLNTIGYDTLLISIGNSEINASNVRLTPRFNKYEYGKQKGIQVDWKDLLVDKVKLEKVDFIQLIESNTFLCQKIIIDEGRLDLFKDKQLPFPKDRVMPMFQDRIRDAYVTLKLDTIQINNLDITQTTRQSSGLTEGSISFYKTNGTITNITNDSSRLLNNRIVNVKANSKIMEKGDLNANFTFDMLDPDNSFTFDAELSSMAANEFNNILEATAFVSVKSGTIKSIRLEATANSSYAYGGMSFLYNNLKVETINKKNLKTKGMGKVLKTFFANTFVVKKNNSKYKLLGRRGSMYYARDKSRITLDYAAKTALSGVVSSIGASSNRKEIKRILKEDKAKRDLELKQKKALERDAKRKG